MGESVQCMNILGSFGYIAMQSIVLLSIISFDADHANRTPSNANMFMHTIYSLTSSAVGNSIAR